MPCRSLAFVAFRHANPYGGFLLCVASLLSCLVGHRSDPYRTLIRSISDTDPDQTGHPSDPIGKLSDISPDDCPTSIGTLSALNRNAVRLQIGLVSGLRRNTQFRLEHHRGLHRFEPGAGRLGEGSCSISLEWLRRGRCRPNASSGGVPGLDGGSRGPRNTSQAGLPCPLGAGAPLFPSENRLRTRILQRFWKQDDASLNPDAKPMRR